MDVVVGHRLLVFGLFSSFFISLTSATGVATGEYTYPVFTVCARLLLFFFSLRCWFSHKNFFHMLLCVHLFISSVLRII